MGFPLKSVQYMRGDQIDAEEDTDNSIDNYLQVYIEDDRDIYLDGVLRLPSNKI